MACCPGDLVVIATVSGMTTTLRGKSSWARRDMYPFRLGVLPIETGPAGVRQRGRMFMSEDENKARARRFIQVWAPGNLSVLDELAAPDTTVIYPVLGEPVRGAAAFKQLLAHFHAACPDVEISVQEQIAEGEKIVTRWSV